VPTIALSSLDGADGFRIDGFSSADQSGYSVANAGDVNGDGFEDVIVGAFGADANGTQSGESYVVFGKAGGFAAAIDLGALDGADGFRIAGISPGDESGRSVASAGDVNGDGYADIVIGAFKADTPDGADAGESYVIFGQAAPFDAVLDLFFLNGQNGFRLNGVAASDKSGVAVSGAGDVNGDGLDDVLIGAFGASPEDRVGAGESYVVFGRTDGFASQMDLADLDGTDGFRVIGAKESDTSGVSVSNAGDVNGDDIDDFIIGAFAADPGGRSGAGESYVIFGRENGFDATLDLRALNGTNGFVVRGVDAYDTSGVSVASAGDVNGDGVEDLIVGAHAADPSGKASAGASYVVFGRTGGFARNLDLIGLDGTDGFRITGINAGDQSGFAVSGAGDFNGDGFDDLIVGALKADASGRVDAGESFLIFGKADGFGATLQLSQLGGAAGFRLTGTQTREFSGGAVSSAGDVDGDGFDDLVIGAFLSGAGGVPYAGASYVVFGGDFTSALTHPGADGDDTRTGGAGADVMNGARGDDVLVGGGGADVLLGAAGDDVLVAGDAGFRRIDGGTGHDLLRLAGQGALIDFAAAGSQGVSGIEAIDLAGQGAAVSLSQAAIGRLSETSNRLDVTGGHGNTVFLADADWRLDAIDGQTTTFTRNAVTLAVDNDVLVTLLQDASLTGDAGDIALANLNYAPRIVAEAATAVRVNHSAQVSIDVSGWFFDPDAGHSLTFGATGLPAGLTFNGAAIVGAANVSAQGAHAVVATATDPTGAQSAHSFTLTVDDTNDAPIVAASAPGTVSVAEEAAAAIDVAAWFFDPDPGEQLSFVATGLPAGLALSGSTIVGTAGDDDIGPHAIQVTATDLAGASVSHTATLVVTNTNDAPVVTAAAQTAVTVDEHAALSIDVSGWFADPDPGDSFVLTAPVLPEGLVFDGVRISAPANVTTVGDHRIDLKATDGAGAATTKSFFLIVEDVPDAPVVTNAAQATLAFAERIAVTFDITEWFRDPDAGDVLSYAATGLPVGLTLQDGLITGAPAAGAAGSHTVVVTATDLLGAKVSTTVLATVAESNLPPSPTGVAPASLVIDEKVQTAIDANAWFSDPDPDDTLTLNAFGLPTGLFMSSGVISGAAAASAAGDHSITVRATDESGVAAAIAFTLRVNGAPDYAVADTRFWAAEDEPFAIGLDMLFDDPNGDALEFAVTGLPAGVSFDASAGEISGVLTAPGDHALTLTATDDRGLSTSQQITLGLMDAEARFGTGGADLLIGSGANVELLGGAGDDLIRGARGGDRLFGEDGNDALYGEAGDDYLEGGAGADSLYGGRDSDRLNGGGGNDRLLGGNLDDILNGDAGEDTLQGDAGADILNGGADNDRLYGGSGDDTLNGGAGADFLDGSGGRDVYNGGSGADRLSGRLDGVADTFAFDAGTGSDRVFRYELGIDRIGLSADFGFTDAADALQTMAAAVINSSGDAILNLNGVDVVQIVDFKVFNPTGAIADLTADIFIF